MSTENEVKNSDSVSSDKKKFNVFKLLIIAVIAVLVIGYGVMTYFYSSHLYHNTTINGINLGDELPENAMVKLENEEGEYNLEIISRGNDGDTVKAVLSGNSIGVNRVYSQTPSDICKLQNPLLWIGGFFTNNDVSINCVNEYDDSLLENVLENISFLNVNNMIAPQDAFICYDGEGKYYIESEIYGNTFDTIEVKDLIRKCVNDNVSSLDLSLMDIYKNPDILSDDEELGERLELLNGPLRGVIVYTFGNEEEILDASVYEKWATISGNRCILDPDKAHSYVENLAKRHDTVDTTGDFTTVDGYVVRLKKGNLYWQIDIDSETEKLIEEIEAGKRVKREPEYKTRAVTFENNTGVGDFYVEVNMTNQRVYLVDKKQIVFETDCVTGHTGLKRGTPTGIYSVYFKQRNRTLRGENYESFVYYWMAFNNHIGLHDATWRGRFGGKIYQRNGSHGCVNLPKKKAAELYDLIDVGTPVICYYLTDDYLVPTSPEVVSQNAIRVPDPEENVEPDKKGN